MVKNSPSNAVDIRDPGSIPGPGRSPGGGHGDPLQYSWRILWTEEPGGLQSKGSQDAHTQLEAKGIEINDLRSHSCELAALGFEQLLP